GQRAGGGAEERAGADEGVEPLGLRRREDLGDDEPGARHRRRGEEAGPDVERDGRGAARERVEGRRDRGAGDQDADELPSRREPTDERRGSSEGDAGPGQDRRRELSQEQRVARGLEDAVAEVEREQRQRRAPGRAPVAGADVESHGYRRPIATASASQTPTST